MKIIHAVFIIAFMISASMLYGIVHDQITARICVEYFTVGHPPVFDTDDPTLLGIGWGIIATWWMGLLLGIPLAVTAQAGSLPTLGVRQLIRPVAVALAAMGALAVVAGVCGNIAARMNWVFLVEPMASRVPPAHHIAFLTDLWAHLASYGGGVVGGIALCIYVWRRRKNAIVAN